MERVLVGTDGSVSAQVAVRWAQGLATATSAELVIAHAWQPTSIELPPEMHEELREQAQRSLTEEWSSEARASGGRVRAVLLDGDPRETLSELADREDADLIVVGARGAGGRPHAFHIGSVTHHLVHHTKRPLAAIPASAPTTFPTTVELGLDGSDTSLRALDWVRDAGSAVAREVIAVYAEFVMAEWVPRWDSKSWYREAVEDCERWTQPLRDAGLSTTSKVLVHEPVPALTEVGVRENAGMIVVGSRGRGGITGLRLGSTALKVLHESGLPVVLVP
ncbi:MAG: universal stress protein [Acidimicrobiia bacterium]|nr:universal stress protein [Acidimicrobiia bacterium]